MVYDVSNCMIVCACFVALKSDTQARIRRRACVAPFLNHSIEH